jgi:hypothetical protein
MTYSKTLLFIFASATIANSSQRSLSLSHLLLVLHSNSQVSAAMLCKYCDIIQIHGFSFFNFIYSPFSSLSTSIPINPMVLAYDILPRLFFFHHQ